MAVRFLPLLFLCTLVATPLSAEPPTPQEEQAPRPQAEQPKQEHPLLRDAFQGQFSKEQLAGFKGQPSLEQLIKEMTPDQRQGARARLGELEQNAKTPADLAELAKGYLMLDEHEPSAGQNAIRVAETLQQMEPEKSTGFSLAASGHHQMGDYPAATEWAKKALERDPNDATALAVYMLSKGRIKRSGMGLPGVAVAGPSQEAGFEASEWVIPEKDVSPQALSLMKQAVAARRAGEMEKTMSLAQAAMNADPASAGMQRFYGIVQEDNKKYAETSEFLRLAKEALDQGRGPEAVSWAQKAAERSKNPTVYKILELMKQQSEKMAQASVKRDLEQKKAPAGGLPLWPIGAGLGLAGIGYGIYRGTKQAYTSEDGLDPNPEVSPEQTRSNYMKSAAVAGTLLVALAAWEFGPGALAAARALFATAGPTAPGLTPAFAGAGTAGGSGVGGALATEQVLVSGGVKAAGTTAVLVGGKAIYDNVSYAKTQQQSSTGQNQPQGPSSSIKRPSATDPKLRNLINDMFRPGNKIPGGTAGAVRNEILTGQQTGGTFHLKKADQYINALDDVLSNRSLSAADRATAEALRQDLIDALHNTRPVIVP